MRSAPQFILEDDSKMFLKESAKTDSLINVIYNLIDNPEIEVNFFKNDIQIFDKKPESTDSPPLDSSYTIGSTINNLNFYLEKFDFNIVFIQNYSFSLEEQKTFCDSTIFIDLSDCKGDGVKMINKIKEVWSEYFSTQDTRNDFPLTYTVSKKVKDNDFEKDFSVLEKHFKLVNKILICDRYLFHDETCGEKNLVRLLKTILKKARNKNIKKEIKIQVVSDSKKHRSVWGKEEVKNLQENIKTRLKGCGKCSLSLYFVPFDNAKKRDNISEHDRSILTNTLRLTSGSGFVLFDKNDNLLEDIYGTTFNVIENIYFDNIKSNSAHLSRIEELIKISGVIEYSPPASNS